MNTIDMRTIERMVSSLNQEIATSRDVMQRLELIQERITLRSVLGSLQQQAISR